MNPSRLNQIRKHMEAQGLRQILVTSSASVYYLTGISCDPHERMLALYLDLDGRCALFGNAVFGIFSFEGGELFLHSDGGDPIEALAGYVKPGKLGIDKAWPSSFLIMLMAARGGLRPVLGSGPVDMARMHKDAEEIAALRHASKVNDSVIMGAIGALHDGASESELAALVNQLFRQNGADGESPQLVCFGENAADPHHSPGGRADCQVKSNTF